MSGKKTKLERVKQTSAREMTRAMVEAAKAIDRLTLKEISLRKANGALAETVETLKKIIISERAQLIYYTQKALDFMHHKDVSVVLTNFADLPESAQEAYVKKAIAEVGSDSPIVPHEEVKAVEEKLDNKKVSLQ